MYRLLIILFLTFGVVIDLSGQEVSSQQKEQQKVEKKASENESFGDYVKKAGQGIWNRLKVRFNLDQRSEELKRKSQQLFGKNASKEDKVLESKKTVPSDTTQNTVKRKPDG